MFKLLSAIPETTESIESLSSDRKTGRNDSKKSTIFTSDSSTFTLIPAKNENFLSMFNKSCRVKSFEVKPQRAANSSQRRLEEIYQIRNEIRNFKEEKANLKHEEKVDFEVRKKMVQLSKLSLKQGVFQNKENLVKRNLEKKQGISNESKANEEFIKRRESYYLKQAIEKKTELKKNLRALSETSVNKDLDQGLDLLVEVKNQEDTIKKLELLLKEEKALAGLLKNSKMIQSLNDCKFKKILIAPGRSRSNTKKN